MDRAGVCADRPSPGSTPIIEAFDPDVLTNMSVIYVGDTGTHHAATTLPIDKLRAAIAGLPVAGSCPSHREIADLLHEQPRHPSLPHNMRAKYGVLLVERGATAFISQRPTRRQGRRAAVHRRH